MKIILSNTVSLITVFLALISLSITCEPTIAPFNAGSATQYEPILIKRVDLENSIRFDPPKPILTTGKIYYRSPLLLVVEPFEGIHIFNNTNPKSPEALGFIKVLGCVDVAVKGNTLYADNSVDMVVFDISNINTIRVVNRIRNIFPEPFPPGLNSIPYEYSNNREPDTYIIKWQLSTNN